MQVHQTLEIQAQRLNEDALQLATAKGEIAVDFLHNATNKSQSDLSVLAVEPAAEECSKCGWNMHATQAYLSVVVSECLAKLQFVTSVILPSENPLEI